MKKTINNEIIKTTLFSKRICSETSVESEALIPDYYPEIMRIIKTEAHPFIRSNIIREDKISVEGVIDLRILYVCQNNKLHSYDTTIPFSHCLDIKSDCLLTHYINVNIVYTNARALNPKKLFIKSSVIISVDSTTENELQKLVKLENENIFYHNEQIKTVKFIGNIQKPTRISDEISIPENNISQIIKYDTFVVETERKVVNNKIIIKGDLVTKIVYSVDNEQFPESITQKSSFSQVFEIKDIEEDFIYNIKYKVNDFNITLKTNTVDPTSAISYDAEIFIDLTIFKNSIEDVCTDIFSISNVLEKTESEIIDQRLFEINKDITVKQSFNIEQCSKIHDFSAIAELEKADYYNENSKMIMTGNMICSVLFTDFEGDFTTTIKKIPFEIDIPMSSDGEASLSECTVNVNACAYVETDNSNIEVRVDAVCRGTVAVMNKKNIISLIEITDTEIPQRSNAITIYYASEDESVFNIAKQYLIDPEIIKQRNNINDYTDRKKAIII